MVALADKNTVVAVPSSWVVPGIGKDVSCYWPSTLPQNEVTELVRQGATPEKHWDTVPVKILKQSSTSQLTKMDTSDDSCEEGSSGARKKKTPQTGQTTAPPGMESGLAHYGLV